MPCYPFVLRGLFALLCTTGACLAQPTLLVRRGGEMVPVSELPDWKPGLGANYGVSGELAGHEALVYTVPNYRLYRVDDRVKEKDSAAAAVADFSLPLTAVGKASTDRQPGIAELWPGTPPEEQSVFALWIQDGRPVLAAPLVVRADRMEASLGLAEGQLGGRPVLVALRAGVLQAPSQRASGHGADPAVRAALLDDAAALRAALDAGLPVGWTDASGASLAEHAAGAGSLACLQVLRDKGFPFADTNAARPGAMELAAARGRTAAVRFLAAAGARVDGRSQSLASPLFLAADHGHLDTVQALVALKADVDEITSHNKVALMAAIDAGHAETAALLIKAGTKPSFNSEQNQLAFITFCRMGRTSIVKLFLANKVSPKLEADGRRPLIEAVLSGNVNTVEALLQAGAPVDAKDDEGHSALVSACYRGEAAMVGLLLKAGAKAGLAAREGQTPLHAAVRSDSPEIIRQLLAAGASPQAANKAGLDPLDLAVIIGAWDSAARLFEAGGRLDTKSPLLDAKIESILRGDQAGLLAQLLKEGLPVDHKLNGPWPLVRLAKACGAKDCLAVLQEAGAVLDEASPYPVVSAKTLAAPFKVLGGERPVDPRPASRDLPAADVTARFLVDGEGKVGFMLLDECSDRLLCVGLSEVVKTWRFTPPRDSRGPVAVWVTQKLHFPSMKERVMAKPKVDTMPVVEKQDPPVYPELQRRIGGMGEVIVAFVVNEEGRTEFVQAIRSSNTAFDQAAVNCVRKWRFSPAKAKGKPVPCSMMVPIVFTLDMS